MSYLQYLAKFNKTAALDVVEFKLRLRNFEFNDNLIKNHNQSNSSSFTMGHNQFSDWHPVEVKAIQGYVEDEQTREINDTLPTDDLAPSINWIDLGAVTSVKHQGRCGSCWAFSAIGVLEGAHAIATGELLDLSEQQLVSCDTGNHGCHGGS